MSLAAKWAGGEMWARWHWKSEQPLCLKGFQRPGSSGSPTSSCRTPCPWGCSPALSYNLCSAKVVPESSSYLWVPSTYVLLNEKYFTKTNNACCNRHKRKENVLPWCYRSHAPHLCLLRPKSRVRIRLFIPLHSLLQNHLLLTLLLSVVDDFRL